MFSVECVQVTVQWPRDSAPRTRKLEGEFAGLGKALLRGTFEQIAKKVLKHPQLKTAVIKEVLKCLAKECISAVKGESVLKNTTTDGMCQFSLKKVCLEWKIKCPLFYSFLMTCAIPPGRGNRDDCEWLPSVGVAGAVLLRERSRNCNAVQLLVSLIIKFSGIQVHVY